VAGALFTGVAGSVAVPGPFRFSLVDVVAVMDEDRLAVSNREEID
jgi:hypothetical protein